MITLRIVSIAGQNPAQIVRQFQDKAWFEGQGKVVEFAEFVRDRMRRIIATSKRRPDVAGAKHKLENLIDIEYIKTTAGVDIGVGNISVLNKLAPYWCLHKETEVYILKDDGLIVPIKLSELYKNRNKIKFILTLFGLKRIYKILETNPIEKYEISTSYYGKIFASGEHRFLCKLGKNILEKRVKNLPIKSLSVYSLLYSSLVSLNKEKIIDSICIDKKSVILDYELGFLIGFILGDGYINKKRIIIKQKKYLDIFKKVKNFCEKYNYYPKIYKDGEIYSICISIKRLYKIFEFFIKGTKENKKINNFFLNSPTDFRQGILDGYKFSDGRSKQKNGDTIRTISKTMRDQLILIASSLGYDISFGKTTKYKNNFTDNPKPLYQGSYYYNTRKFLSKWRICNKVSLGNKRDIFGRYVSGNNYFVEPFEYKAKSLKSVKKINNNDVFYDLWVEDNLFIIDGGIVTHNSVLNSGCTRAGRPYIPNYGGWVRGGQFVPGEPKPDPEHFREGQWMAAGGGEFRFGMTSYTFRPKRAIIGINYIEITKQELRHKVERETKEFMEKIKGIPVFGAKEFVVLP